MFASQTITADAPEKIEAARDGGVVSQGFFGHCEKNSSSEKLKTQAKSRKNSSKIRKKLKNRQLQLSSDGGIFLQTLKFSPFLPMWSIFEIVNLKVH